ncbi:MAG TPA: hypothetical protein VIX81_07155, partial [Gammaproteobacteria bacterium]
MRATHELDSLQPDADDRLLRQVRRYGSIVLFVLLIAATLASGYLALQLLNSSRSSLNGPRSPVPAALEAVDESLRQLVSEEHSVPLGQEVLPRPRLRALYEGFHRARVAWLEVERQALAVDLLLSRRLDRQLESFDAQFAAMVAEGAPQRPAKESYDQLLVAAVELQRTLGVTQREQLKSTEELHAAVMQQIASATQRFVALATLALVAFLVLAAFYLRQVRNYDRNIDTLHDLAGLFSGTGGVPLFEGMVRFLGRALGTDYVFIGKLNPNDRGLIDT